MAFGNLSLSEILLLMAAVLLLMGARTLGAMHSPDRAVRVAARRGYRRALAIGLALGLGTSALVVPDPDASVLFLTTAAGIAMVALGLSWPVHASQKPITWDPGMTASLLLAWSITTDVITWWWPSL